MIQEIKNVLWFNTPLGRGQALFIIDYGPHQNTIWVIAIEKTGEVKHFDSNQINLEYNNTLSYEKSH